ncbi:MAG: glutamyl-tRNA reductase [Dermatophilaceae bacterium]
MSVVVMGLSHRSAPIAVLEALTLGASDAAALATAVSEGENVEEVVVLATCNRVEIYAAIATFHGAVTEIGDALSAASGIPLEELREHLYVHYEDRAISHVFSVASGLDSMAVGEGQVLGQLRTALRRAQKQGHAGATLNGLFQQALRVGKRAHSETGIDSVSVSMVDIGLRHAAEVGGPLADARVVVVGAGSMSSLAATTISRLGCADLVIINRTLAKAQHLAEATGGRAVPFDGLEDAMSQADIIISCTGAVGHVITAKEVAAAAGSRSGGAQVFIDLALPRDVAPGVADFPGVHVVGLAEIGETLAADERFAPHVKEVSDLVVEEVAGYLTDRRADDVAPTVAALRHRAADVVAAELSRLEQRLPDEMSRNARAEIQLTMHRVVEKLLHTPTVRVKELAGDGHGGDYALALRELFDLDPHDVAAVSVPPETGALA